MSDSVASKSAAVSPGNPTIISVDSATSGSVARIAATYHAWRDSGEEPGYQDVPGFCKAVSIEEIVQHDFVLSPSRFVGLQEQLSDGEPVEERLARVRGELYQEFEEADRLEALIRQRLDSVQP